MRTTEEFKKTLAGMSYIELYKIFERAPDSADKTAAIAVLTQAFNDHFQLWNGFAKCDAPNEKN